MTPPIPADAKKFRMKILPGVIYIFFCWVTGLLIGAALFFTADELCAHWLFVLKNLCVPTFGLFLFAFVYSAMISMVFPSYVSSVGIYGHSFWGFRRFVSWEAIISAKRFRMVNLKFLRLYCNGSPSPVWIALLQKPSPEFGDEIRKVAPANNPLLKFLS